MAAVSIALLTFTAACTGAEPRPLLHSDPLLGACLDAVEYPGIPGNELNGLLPVKNVDIEFVQSELAVHRGSGYCADSSALLHDWSCPLLESAPENLSQVMLDSTPDRLTEAEFARGATAVLTETMTGHTEGGAGTFMYRMTAWHYPTAAAASGSLVLDVVRHCEGAVVETVRGIDQTVVAQSEPHIVALQMDDTAYLIESIRPLAGGEPLAGIPDTASGLLPATALTVIRDWWIEYATSYFGRATPAVQDS